MLWVCLATYEAAPPKVLAKACGEAPKLSPYIGFERLDRYPPPEFEEVFEQRRQAEVGPEKFGCAIGLPLCFWGVPSVLFH